MASLPASGAIEVVGSKPGSCRNNRRLLRCNTGDLASGASFVVDIEARSHEAHDQGLMIWAMSDRVDPETERNRIVLTLPEAERPPEAGFSRTCDRLVCTFDASPSDGGSFPITSYQWELGDGGTAPGDVVNHDYHEEGEYTVTLTVGIWWRAVTDT